MTKVPFLGDGSSEELSLTTCRGSIADEETILQTPRDPEVQAMETVTSHENMNRTMDYKVATPGIAYRTRSKDREIPNPKVMMEGQKSTLKTDIEYDM